MSKTKELGEKIEAAEQERLDKLEAFDSHMRLTRRLDEAERARDKVFKDAATQLAEAKERYQALQLSKDLLGMEKARLNQKYVQALARVESYKACINHSHKELMQLQGYVDDGKRILLAAGVAGVAFSALIYFMS